MKVEAIQPSHHAQSLLYRKQMPSNLNCMQLSRLWRNAG